VYYFFNRLSIQNNKTNFTEQTFQENDGKP